MDKVRFMREFRAFITVWFDNYEFVSNPFITVHSSTRPLKDFLDFYSPWWYDRSGREVARIEDVLADKSMNALTITDAARHPEKWDTFSTVLPLNQIWPIPIATDTTIGKTLILDSNKTLCRLVFKSKHPLDQKITVVEIVGPDLQRLNGDLKALRQRISQNDIAENA